MQEDFKPISLGRLSIWPPVIGAPMAGYTDGVFRELLREYGCPYCYTEMVSAKGLLIGGENTIKILNHSRYDRPLAVQLFGKDPDVMARAATKVKELKQPFDAIDINMGCPAPKITSQGAGGALLKDLGRARAIVQAVKEATKLSVTVKLRLGWDSPERIVEIGQTLAEAGADMLAVHGRTVCQGYSGSSNWDAISKLAKNVSVPVVGNGDILSPSDAIFRLKTSGCSGIMVGRALLGNPFFFKQIKEYLDLGNIVYKPSLEERLMVAKEHFQRAISRHGKRLGLLEMRKHLVHYFKGFRGASKLREIVVREDSWEKVLEILSGGWRDI